ncbi:MAG TPA: hypothetical protein V6D22_02990 [Candidatus Obscuribacterales bacterium]
MATCLSAFFLLPFVAMEGKAANAGDLSSTQTNATAAAAGAIRVGGHLMHVTQGQALTPAESFALNQVLQTGRQTLHIGALGNAVSGLLNINGISGASLGNLVIPRNVHVLDNVAASQLNLTGGLTNAGSLFLYSTNSSSPSALINATDIINRRGGLLSSIVPSNYLKGLSPISGLNLDLTALNNIINAGTIRSAGSLTLTAGNTINNSGILSAAGTAGDVNLSSNNIINSGLIQSLGSNINISAPNTATITVNNANGLLQALLGDINVRDASFTAKSDFDLTGGNLLSKVLNISTGNGSANVDVKNITGIVNINAGIEHLVAATRNLNIGTQNLTGDPTIYNLNGNINLTNTLTPTGGAPLAIIASGNITSGGTTPFAIDTHSATGAGGSIMIIAGAKITANPSGLPGTNTDTNNTTFTITGGSKTGGEIDLLDVPVTGINSSSTSGAGGDITIAAFKGSGAGSGFVLLPAFATLNNVTQNGVNINASGTTTNGNVTIIGSAIEFTGVASSTGGVGANNVNIIAANPTLTNGTPIQILNGAVTAGSFNVNPTVLSTGNIVESSNVAAFQGINAGGNINIKTGGEMQLDNLTAGATGAGTVNLQTGGLMILDGQITAPGNVTVSATKGGTIEYFGNIQSTAGNVTINGGTIQGIEHALNQQISNGSNWKFLLGVTADNPTNAHFLYVPDFELGTITKINAQTDAVVSSVQLNSLNPTASKPEGTAISPDGSTLYVANSGDGTFSAVTTSGSMTAGVRVGVKDTSGNALPGNPNPEGIAVSPNGNQIYVLVNSAPVFQTTGTPPNQTFVLNPKTHTPVITSFGQATVLVYNTSGLSTSSKPVAVIQLGTAGKVLATQTGGISINPQGTLAYVSASGSNAISIINLSNNSVSRVIQLPKEGNEYPIFTAMDPNGNHLYVADGFSNNPFITTQTVKFASTQGSILVIDTASGSPTFDSVIANIPQPQIGKGTGTFPQGISVNPAGTELSVQATYLNQINIISTALNQTVNALFTGADLTGQFGSAPDGYGSSSFSTVVTAPAVHPIPVETTFTSNTFNLRQGVNGTVSAMVKPTIQANNITLTSTGNISVDYDTKGGTFIANAVGQVMADDLGSGGSHVGASRAGALFQIGAMEPLTIDGAVSAPGVSLQTSGASNIILNNTVGQSNGTVAIQTGTGSILEGASGFVVGKGVSLVSQSGNIDTNFTSGTFTKKDDPNAPGSVASLQLSNTGLGPIRLESLTVGGTPQVEGVDYTFNDSTGVVTFLTGHEPSTAAAIVETSQTGFQTATQSLTALTANTVAPLPIQSGSVFVNNTSSALTLGGATGTALGTETFQVASTGTITVGSGGVVAPNVDLRSVGNLAIGGQIGFANTPGNAINLVTGGKGAITDSTGAKVLGETLNLAAGSTGIGTTKAPLIIDVSQLIGATATGTSASIFLSQPASAVSNITVGNSAATGASPISTPGTFALVNNGGNILYAGTDVANSKTLILTSSGSIGAPGFPASGTSFLTDANSATIQAGGSAYIGASAPPSILGAYTFTINKGSSAGGTFSVNTDLGAFNTTSNINVAGITASIVNLTTDRTVGLIPGSGGSVTIAGNINASSSVTINTDAVVTTNSLGDTFLGNAIVQKSGTITSPAVTLITDYGNIGSAKAPISITAPTAATSTVIVTPGQNGGTATGVSQAFVKGTGNVNITNDGSGSIGTSTNPINLSLSGILTITAPTGSAYINLTNGSTTIASASSVLNVLSIENTSGSLTLGSTGGTLATTPTEIDLSAKSNLSFTGGLANAQPNVESLTAGGKLALSNSTITVGAAPTTGDGGQISITAGSVSIPSNIVPLTLNANADNGFVTPGTHANGGNITFTIKGSQPFIISSAAITPPAGTIRLQLDAAGDAGSISATGLTGNGGTLNVAVGGNVTADQSGLNNAAPPTVGGNGGTTSVSAGGLLLVNGGLSTANGGSGAADGSITLSSNAAKPFFVGGSGTITNGITGTLTAANVTIDNPKGITLSEALPVSGGTVEFDTASLVNNSSVSGESKLTVDSLKGSLVVSGTGTWGTPTKAWIFSHGNIATGPLFTIAAPLQNTASNIEIEGFGVLTLGFSSLTAANPGGLNVSGIVLQGSTIKFSDTATHTLTAGSTNSEGLIQFIQTGTQAVNVGGSSPNNIVIDIQATSTPINGGGLINVTSGGKLTVDATNGLFTSSGPNTSLTLSSGANLSMSGFSQSLVGTSPNLIFASKSTTPFTITTDGTNPINGVGLPNGASPLSAFVLNITNSGGSVGTSATPITINATNVAFNAGKSGLVNVVDTGSLTSNVNLDGSSAGTSFTLSATDVGSTFSQSSGIINTPSLSLTVRNMSGSVSTNATTITGFTEIGTSAANFSIIDSATKTLTIPLTGIANNGTPGNTGSISLQTSGPVNIIGSLVADNVSVTSVGNMSIGNHIGTINGSGGAINLDTSGVGSITMTPGGGGQILGDSLTLTAGTGIGTAGTPLTTDVSTLNGASLPGLTGSSSIFINNVGTGLFTIAGTGVTAPGTFKLVSAGGITIAQAINQTTAIFLQSGGDITISANFGSTPEPFFGFAGSNDTLIASGNIISTGNFSVRGNNVTLTASGAGGVGFDGTTVSPIQTTARLLTVNATGGPNASAYVNGTDDFALFGYVLTVKSANANNDLSITTSTSVNQPSDIVVSGVVSAPHSITLSTGLGTDGSISLGSVVGGSQGSATVNISADGTGSITATSAGGIAGNTVTLLSTGTGNIGTLTAPIKITGASTLSANTSGTTGTVVLINTSATTGLTLNQSSSGGVFSLTDNSQGVTLAGSALLVAGSVTTNAPQSSASAGNLTIVEKGGSIDVENNLTARGGSIVVQDLNATGAEIDIGKTSTANITTSAGAGGGMVTIAFGTVPAPKTNPNQVPVAPTGTSGTAWGGINPSVITHPSGTTSLVLDGADIVFNVPASGAIKLFNTTITADPTILPSAPVTALNGSGLTPAATMPAATVPVATISAPQSGLTPAATMQVPTAVPVLSVPLAILKPSIVLPTDVQPLRMLVMDTQEDPAARPIKTTTLTDASARHNNSNSDDLVVDTSED